MGKGDYCLDRNMLRIVAYGVSGDKNGYTVLLSSRDPYHTPAAWHKWIREVDNSNPALLNANFSIRRKYAGGFMFSTL